MGQADQAYVYVTDSQADWIGRLLTSQPELKQQPLSILALPGAHDAGMFRGLDTDEAARDLVDGLVGRYVSKEALAAALAGGYLVAGAVSLLMPVMHLIAGLLIALRTTSMARRALINFSYTQKDDITTQLLLGTRFFDFRPGYNASFFRRDQELRHQHGWRPPSPLTRFMIRQIIRLPRFFSDVTVLCGEIIGVASFMLLRERAAALFADQAAPAQRLQYLLTQLLADEIGHVYYLRSRLGPVRLRLARLLLPVIARSMIKDIPEVVRLFGREELLTRILDPHVVGTASAACEGALSLEYQPA